MDTYKKIDEDRFFRIYKETFEIKDEGITNDLATGINELEIPFNSITFIKFIVKLEIELNIEIIEDDLDFVKYKTLGDIMSMVNRIIEKQ